MTSPYKSDQCLEHIDFGYLWLIRLSSENILNADLFATCLIPIDHTDVPECVKRDLPGMEHFPNCSQEARILFLGRNQLYSKNEKCHLGRQMFYVVVSCPSLPVYMYVYIIDIIWYIYTHSYITFNLSNIHTSAFWISFDKLWLWCLRKPQLTRCAELGDESTTRTLETVFCWPLWMT